MHLSEYDERWPSWFERIRHALPEGLVAEHVGSTSVPGLLAKPIVDVDVVIESADSVAGVLALLEAAGWAHEGDRGIPGREAFESRPDLPPHHLYLVVRGSAPHRDHTDLRDHLRASTEDAVRYSDVKRSLAHLLPHDRAAYTEGKAAIVSELLSRSRERG